ncbi:MAG: hypothetical protein QXU98_13970 [Candidatus Parvarchaeota archaeon]
MNFPHKKGESQRENSRYNREFQISPLHRNTDESTGVEHLHRISPSLFSRFENRVDIEAGIQNVRCIGNAPETNGSISILEILVYALVRKIVDKQIPK